MLGKTAFKFKLAIPGKPEFKNNRTKSKSDTCKVSPENCKQIHSHKERNPASRRCSRSQYEPIM